MTNNFINNNNNINKFKKLTKNDILAVFIRSNLFQGSWNFERMQSLGFCFSIIPVIKRLYLQNSKEQKRAIKRHLEFFNTHPYMAAPILGIIIAMEEEKVNKNHNNSTNDNNNENSNNNITIDDAFINGLKIGLMGPFAGIGDPIFWGTIRPIFAALGSGMASNGSILGPSLFFILFNATRLTTRYYGIKYGYRKGINFVKEIQGKLLQKITEGSSILGLFIMGALVNKWTHINIPYIISQTTDDDGHIIATTTIQNALDQLMPGFIPLLLTFMCMWLLNKKINTLWIIAGFFGIGILGHWIGLLGL